MSVLRKEWIGIGFAVLVASGLAVTDLVDGPEEWDELQVGDLVGGELATDYETASASLPAVSAASAPGLQAERRDDDLLDPAATISSVPASVRGVDPHAVEVLNVSHLSVDRAGHFAPTPAAVELFESYYRAYPDSSDDVIRGRLVLALLDGLSPRAADEAITTLDRWRAARAAEFDLGVEASAAERERVRRAELGDELARSLSR